MYHVKCKGGNYQESQGGTGFALWLTSTVFRVLNSNDNSYFKQRCYCYFLEDSVFCRIIKKKKKDGGQGMEKAILSRIFGSNDYIV